MISRLLPGHLWDLQIVHYYPSKEKDYKQTPFPLLLTSMLPEDAWEVCSIRTMNGAFALTCFLHWSSKWCLSWCPRFNALNGKGRVKRVARAAYCPQQKVILGRNATLHVMNTWGMPASSNSCLSAVCK